MSNSKGSKLTVKKYSESLLKSDDLLQWYNKLTQEDKDTIEYYVDSSYPIMYYLYIKRDKKLQQVFKSLFKNAYILKEDIVVYRGINVKKEKDIIPKMSYPFSVSFDIKVSQKFIDNCCVIKIILPKGTKILSPNPSDNDDKELIVEPGNLHKTSSLKYTFVPTGISFDKKIVLPKDLVNKAIDFLRLVCIFPHLKKYNRTITKTQFQTYFQQNYEKIAKDNCINGTVYFKPFKGYDKPYGLLYVDKNNNIVSYLRGLKNEIYVLFCMDKHNKIYAIGYYRMNDLTLFYKNEILTDLVIPYNKIYKKYTVYAAKANEDNDAISDYVKILEASGNLKKYKNSFRNNKDYIELSQNV